MEKIQKYVPPLFVILSVFLVVLTINALKANQYIGGEGVPQNVITVSGDSEVFSPPDVANFTFSVVEVGKTNKEAQTKVTEKMDKALKAIKDLGIEDKDVRTVDYSAYPKYEYSNSICTQFSCPPSRQTIVGYEVSQTISVKVRNVDDAGKVIDAATSAGASNVSGLSYSVDEPEELERQARKQAIDEAKAKAEVLAKDLGVRLVRIVNFSENGNYPIPFYKAELGMGGADAVSQPVPSLPTGENKITSSVTITYEIR